MKKCIGTDKRILSLVIAFAMFATTFSCGFVFAEEENAAAGEVSGEPAQTEQTQTEEQTQNEDEEDEAQVQEENAAEEESQQTQQAAEPVEQSLTVRAVYSESNQVLLKPDASGNYVLNTSISKIRNTKSFKLTITNPAGCDISLTPKATASNSENGEPFIEIESMNLIDSADGDSSTSQVTEAAVKVNGTGESYITYKAAGSEEYLPASGKITICQIRSTKIMQRSASVTSKSASPAAIKKLYKGKMKNFELKEQSGISEFGYGIAQGGNSDGTYSYTAMVKKGSTTYIKIIKTRLSDMKVVKTSGDLKLDHANDITYDPANNRLVVTHNNNHTKRVSFVNPDTLKVTGYKDITVPSTLKGAVKSQLSRINGFASITYVPEGKYEGNYIAVISNYHDFLVLDKNFVPVEYVSVSARYDSSIIYYQGADVVNGDLYIGVYPRNFSYNNIICVYDQNGEYKGNINLIKGFEMENIYHSGNYMYATLCKNVTKTWYTTKTVKKKVKVKKKKGKKKKKYKYKYKKVKVKVKHSAKVKRSYIYRMPRVTL